MRIRVTTRKVTIGTIFVTLLFVGMAVAMTSTSSAGFCSSCKNMKPAVRGYKISTHKGVNCEQCHTEPGPFFFLTAKMEALQEPISQFFGTYELPIVGTVANQSCRRCHTDDQLFGVISKNGINVSHKHLIQAGFQCVNCHSTVAHGDAVPVGSRTYPTMDKCLVCHNNKYTAADGTVAVATCNLCHKQPNYGSKPISHDSQWLTTHGSMGILSTCSACHTKPNACSRCHNGLEMPHVAGWLTKHGATVKTGGKNACSLCHDTKVYCQTCHQVQMPHPKDFLGTHNIAAANAKDTCFTCHQVANCQACHDAHGVGTPAAHDLFKGETWSPSPTASGL
jgi:nitrate/TMAO reductase-like tetraheme cytochrome c subunit